MAFACPSFKNNHISCEGAVLSVGSSVSKHSCQSCPSSFFNRDCKLHNMCAAHLFIVMKTNLLRLEAKLEPWFQEAKCLQTCLTVVVRNCWWALSVCGLLVGLWGQVAYQFWVFPSLCFGFCFYCVIFGGFFIHLFLTSDWCYCPRGYIWGQSFFHVNLMSVFSLFLVQQGGREVFLKSKSKEEVVILIFILNLHTETKWVLVWLCPLPLWCLSKGIYLFPTVVMVPCSLWCLFSVYIVKCIYIYKTTTGTCMYARLYVYTYIHMCVFF